MTPNQPPVGTELKACPFCGGEAEHLGGCVRCTNNACPVDVSALTSEQWNTRTPTEAEPGEAEVERFFIDHGMIHDRVTGKHVTTAPDDEIWNGQCITETCALLNSLAPPSVSSWASPSLTLAARAVCASAATTYRKADGSVGSIEGDDGEICWIVPHDEIVELRAAIAALRSTTPASEHDWRIGRFQADDESECSRCGVQSDEPAADQPCSPATGLVEPSEAMIEAGQKAYDTPNGPSINDFDTEVEWQRAYVAYLYRAMQSAAPGSSEGDKHKRAQDEYRRLKGGDDVDDAAFEAALNAPGSSPQAREGEQS